MAYSNYSQNNQKDNAPSVNTRGVQLSNKDGFDPSTLAVGMWNEFVSLRISPVLEASKQTQNKVYDYEKTVSTALTLEKVMSLIYGIENKIIPAIKNGENASIGVSVGGDGVVSVGTGLAMTGDIRPFFAIHKSLNENTKIPEMSIYYEFNKSMMINDFDAKTGKYVLDNNSDCELLLFLELLKAMVSGMSNGATHASRVTNRYANECTTGMLEEIVGKLGISSNFIKGNGRSYSKNIFNSNTSSYNSNTDDGLPFNGGGASAANTSVENLSDIDSFLS